MIPDRPRLWFQIRIGEGRFGPGKAELLAHIRDTGSLSAAARAMGMSYRRAWTLLEAVNALTGEAAVETERGGATGGGSRLTPHGERLLTTYEDLRVRLGEAAGPALDGLVASRTTED